MKNLNDLLDWLIPDHLKEDSYIYKKAKVLSYIHLFIFLILLVMIVGIKLYLETEENPPLYTAMLILFGLFYTFKRFGNLTLSGNLIAFFWIIVVAPSVGETGGLHSDNLLWLVISPLIAFLFATRTSGVVWSIFLIGFTIHYYIQDLEVGMGSFKDQTQQFDSSYFFISYLGLFISIIGIVIIFKNGLEEIIKLLKESRAKLRTQQKEVENKNIILKATEEKLLKTNKELEHFAYAASHDLKEPLRMIKIYTQLLEKKLQSSLDPKSKEFMHFVTDGTVRMERLLDDLLEYSRLGRSQTKNQKDVNLNDILFIVMSNLMASMREKNASIFSTQLPTIFSSSTEMTMLFQNIIANAMKFKKPDVNPVIHIKNRIEGEFHIISIRDNGIGIAEENISKVFKIFERLHSKSEYEGSGIGLSTCKKIIDNMGGEINITSVLGEGTTFHISIPKIKKGIEAVA